MKHILVPTDFSKNSEAAIHYAYRLAGEFKAKIFIMHSCDLLRGDYVRHKTIIREHNHDVITKSRKELDELCKRMETIYTLETATILCEHGDTIDNILHSIRAHKIDLLIMGSYGDKGLRRKLFGSKPASLVNKTTVPLITVPDDYQWAEQNEFVICVEDHVEDIVITEPFFEIAKAHNSKVYVAIFSEKQDSFEPAIEDEISVYFKRKMKRVYPSGEIEVVYLVGDEFITSMMEFISARNIDMICMITYKRNFLQEVFDISVTKKMSYKTNIPLLSLKKKQFERIDTW